MGFKQRPNSSNTHKGFVGKWRKVGSDMCLKWVSLLFKQTIVLWQWQWIWRVKIIISKYLNGWLLVGIKLHVISWHGVTIVDEPTWYGIWQICKHGYFADKWLLTQEDFLGKVWLWKKVNNKLVFGWNLNCQCSKNANEFWKDCSKVQTLLPKKIEEQKIQAYWLSYLCFALVETWYVNLLFVLFMFGLDKRPSSLYSVQVQERYTPPDTSIFWWRPKESPRIIPEAQWSGLSVHERVKNK